MLLKDEMRLKRKNLIIMWTHWKTHFLRKRGGSQKKTIYRGNCLKRGLGKSADLKERGLAKESNALYVDCQLSPG